MMLLDGWSITYPTWGQWPFRIRTWLKEIQQFDWLVTVVKNSRDHAVENHVLETIDNDLNCGLLSSREF